MAEQAPDPISCQVNELLADIVSSEGHKHERMTSDVVAGAAEAAGYVLHDAQLEGSSLCQDRPAEVAVDPLEAAEATLRQAIGNKTLKGLLGDISGAA